MKQKRRFNAVLIGLLRVRGISRRKQYHNREHGELHIRQHSRTSSYERAHSRPALTMSVVRRERTKIHGCTLVSSPKARRVRLVCPFQPKQKPEYAGAHKRARKCPANLACPEPS